MKMMKPHQLRFRGYVIVFLRGLAEWQRKYGRIKELEQEDNSTLP